MAKRRHTAEQIIAKLREAEVLLAKGTQMPQVCRKLGVTEPTYYRWRKEYGGVRTVDEAYRPLQVAEPRRLFYSVQLWTGLRVGEAAALQWGDVLLEGDRPCIRLRAATTKARRADELPLHPDLVEALTAAKPPFAQPKDKVFMTAPRLRTFKGGWYQRNGERRYRIGDLDRAQIPFEDDSGRTVDRHTLRTMFNLVAGFLRCRSEGADCPVKACTHPPA